MAVILQGACSPAQPAYGCSSSVRMPISNLHFQPLWSRTGIAIRLNRSDALMQGFASKVFVVTGQDFEYGGSRILAIDTLSGNVLWQREIVLPASIIMSNNQLYAGFYNKIEILDPPTGSLVNAIEISNVGVIYNIFATNQNLFALTNSGRWLTYNIDNSTYSLSEPFLPYTPFLIENGIMYFREAGIYKARDTKTQSILWEYPLDEAANVHPLITKDMIIIFAQTENIYGLDKSTGTLKWKVNAQIISNIAADESRLYFLTNDGYLKVLDMKSGQEIEKLEFNPLSFALNNPSSENIIGAYDLWVDAENDIIIVSFGDSCQLMALKYSLPQE
jgi:outer membrane protein assembly factor BamB